MSHGPRLLSAAVAAIGAGSAIPAANRNPFGNRRSRRAAGRRSTPAIERAPQLRCTTSARWDGKSVVLDITHSGDQLTRVTLGLDAAESLLAELLTAVETGRPETEPQLSPEAEELLAEAQARTAQLAVDA